jgi:hypothetical protein
MQKPSALPIMKNESIVYHLLMTCLDSVALLQFVLSPNFSPALSTEAGADDILVYQHHQAVDFIFIRVNIINVHALLTMPLFQVTLFYNNDSRS